MQHNRGHPTPSFNPSPPKPPIPARLESHFLSVYQFKTIDGVDYLFVEAGGYSWRAKAGWKPDWLVLKRK